MEEKRSRISAPVWVVDNDDVRQTIRFALATHGMNVRTFPSGEAFLEEVDLDRPGVLVLDLHMEGNRRARGAGKTAERPKPHRRHLPFGLGRHALRRARHGKRRRELL